MPLDIIHIIICFIKGVDWSNQVLCSAWFCKAFCPPQLYNPICWTCQEKIWEVYRANQRVEVESHDWTWMTLVGIILISACLCTCTIILIGLANIPFSPHPECSHLVIGQVKCCDCIFTCLVMSSVNQLKSFLNRISVWSKLNLACRPCLWLHKHVHQPTTHSAIHTAHN